MNLSSFILSVPENEYALLPNRYIVSTPFHKKKHVSYGIMLWCEETDAWLLVRSKHSYAFYLFLNGAYRKSDLVNILNNMTTQELSYVRQLYLGSKKWEDIYTGPQLDSAKERFYDIKNMLRSLMYGIEGTPCTTWTFPKGRLEHRETPWYCAIREFYEEAGFDITSGGGQCVSNYVVMESYTSFNREVYETHCWIFKCKKEHPLVQPVGEEIAERQWVKTLDIHNYLSPSKYAMLQVALEQIKQYDD